MIYRNFKGAVAKLKNSFAIAPLLYIKNVSSEELTLIV
ncbi:hypothetical protein CLFE_038310 [Clostridium felsineum DSM 794]|nr:hypothetical protein CLFE_038310 [Clostridium felsineum DSM 794]